MAKEFDREGLRKFVRQSEGEPPPVFVGRKETIEDILDTANGAYKPSELKHGTPKATRVLHGAPGSGKSSTLVELETRCRAQYADSRDAPRIVSLHSQQLTAKNLPKVLAAIALGGVSADVNAEKVMHEIRTKVVKFFNLNETTMDFTRYFKGPPPVDLDELAERFPQYFWEAPVIVAVDEAQRLSGDDTTPHAKFLQSIHDNTLGLPLTLVLAGLGDTLDRANEVGLTRGLTPHEIGCLPEKEYKDLMHSFCEHFGLSGYTGAQLARLARPAEGWPRHLHFALQALGNKALDVDGDLSRIDWDRTIREAAETRLNYYHDQRSTHMVASADLVKAVMTELEDRMDASDIDRLIERSVADEAGMRLPEVGPDDNLRFMRPREFRQHLVHQGALELRRNGTYHCPIPSNRTFLMSRGKLTVEQLMEAATDRQGTSGQRMNFGIELS